MSDAAVLWPGGPVFTPDPAFPVGADSVLLADFASSGRAERAMDLGCGAGLITLLLLLRSPRLAAEGLEIRGGAAELARMNLAQNGLEGRSRIREGDLRQHRQLYASGSFDLVVCNPPYFPSGRGSSAPGEERRAARSEESCTLAEVCAAAAFLCRNGGAFCLVHRAERLAEVMSAMSAAGLEPKRLRLVAHRADAAPSLLLAEGRRGAKPGLSILPQLALKDGNGEDSPEIRRIYHFEKEAGA